MVEIFTQAEVDRTLYEHLRRAVVVAGYLPDIAGFSDPAAYKAARIQLKSELGEHGRLIDIMGIAVRSDREAESACKVVIDCKEDSPGQLGGFPVTFYEKTVDAGADSKFSKKFYPDRSSDINYELRSVADSAKYDRIIRTIIKNTFKGRRYFKTVDEDGDFTEKEVFIESMGSVLVSSKDSRGADLSSRDAIERVFRFVVRDVFLEEPEELYTDIPVLSTVEYFVYLSTLPIEENIIDGSPEQGAGGDTVHWQEKTIDIPAETTLVYSEFFENTALGQMMYLSDTPFNWIKRGVIHDPDTGILDFGAFGSVGGDQVYLTFNYKLLS